MEPLNRLWSEIWTKDNALHVAAGLPVIAILYFSGVVDAVTHGAALYGLILYVREVTQYQTTAKWKRHYEDGLPAKMNGFEGWTLDLHHNAEWMVPTAALVGASWIIDLNIN